MTRVALALLLFSLAGIYTLPVAHAAGWVTGGYTVPDSLPAQVYGILCQGGTCSEKAVWDSAGGYGVPVTEGPAGSRAAIRVSLSSSGSQNVVLYLWRERAGKVSPEIAPVRIVTQARSDTLMAWARRDSALIAWAQPVAGTSPLNATYAYSFSRWESEDAVLMTQSAIQWHYAPRFCEIFGYYCIGGGRRLCE